MLLFFDMQNIAIEANLLKNDFNFFNKLQRNKMMFNTYITLKILNKLNQFNN